MFLHILLEYGYVHHGSCQLTAEGKSQWTFMAYCGEEISVILWAMSPQSICEIMAGFDQFQFFQVHKHLDLWPDVWVRPG